jgi:hypothetical protein
MHPGSRVLWGCSAPPAILPRSPQLRQNGGSQLYLQLGKQRKVGWVGNEIHVVFISNFLVKKEVWDGVLSWCNSEFFVAKFWGEVFVNFHGASAKCHSSMQNWLFGLPGTILYEQSPWCQRKWACSRRCSSSLSPCLVSVNLVFSIGRTVALSKGHNRKSCSRHQR